MASNEDTAEQSTNPSPHQANLKRTAMPVTHVNTDVEHRTVPITAEFAVPVERVWASAPTRANSRRCGSAEPPRDARSPLAHPQRPHPLLMKGPDGAKHPGGWQVNPVDDPRSFEFEDVFTKDAATFVPEESMPSTRLSTGSGT